MTNKLPMQLKTHRKLSKETSDKIASILNVAGATYRRYENGTRTIPIETVITLAAHYGITTDELLGHTPNRANAAIHQLKELGYTVTLQDNSPLVKVRRTTDTSTIDNETIYESMEDLTDIVELATKQAIAAQLPSILENIFLKKRNTLLKGLLSKADLPQRIADPPHTTKDYQDYILSHLAAQQDKPKEKALPNPKE